MRLPLLIAALAFTPATARAEAFDCDTKPGHFRERAATAADFKLSGTIRLIEARTELPWVAAVGIRFIGQQQEGVPGGIWVSVRPSMPDQFAIGYRDASGPATTIVGHSDASADIAFEIRYLGDGRYKATVAGQDIAWDYPGFEPSMALISCNSGHFVIDVPGVALSPAPKPLPEPPPQSPAAPES